MIIFEWLIQEPVERKPRKIYNPKQIKRRAREKIEKDDKQLNKLLAKKMINPYHFSNRALQVGFIITLDGHLFNHANSILIPKTIYSETEIRYIDKILELKDTIFARLINQNILKNQTVLSARFYKQDEDGQILEETELFKNLGLNQKLTQNDFDNIIVRFQ